TRGGEVWGHGGGGVGAGGRGVGVGGAFCVGVRPQGFGAVPGQALRGGTIRVSRRGSRALAPGLRARRVDRRAGGRKLPAAAAWALLAGGEHLYSTAAAARRRRSALVRLTLAALARLPAAEAGRPPSLPGRRASTPRA